MAKDTLSSRVEHVLEQVEAHGPCWFVTRRILRDVDGALVVWHARRHRKALTMHAIETTIWQPRQLNWWIGLIFMLGASLFALGSLLCLAPSLATQLGLSSAQVNASFFIGSIPFTTAAYLQLYQAANAPGFNTAQPSNAKRAYFGWKPQDAGWISCVLQFIGTILFNFNTFDASLADLSWAKEALLVWVPNIVGSILFLASGYLAFIETCHRLWAFRPREISWWVTSANLIGCIAFMISACFAFVPRQAAETETLLSVSILFTFIGAIGFFVGSFLMWPEIISEAEPSSKPSK